MSQRTLAAALGCLLAVPALAAPRERVELRHVALDLPGPPARVLPTDLDGDGRLDLVVVTAHTEIRQVGEDRIEELIHVTRVIPTVFDRRQARAWLATADGSYRAVEPPLDLPRSVLHLEPGPPGAGLLALTDEGFARLRYAPQPDAGPALRLEPLVDDPPVLAGTGRFYSNLELVHDLDGDGVADALLPTSDGLAVYLGGPGGLSAEAADRVRPPGSGTADAGDDTRSYALPEVRDVDGDGLPDLVFSGLPQGRGATHVLLGAGAGRFRPLREVPRDCHDRGTDLRLAGDRGDRRPWPDDVTELRDLDGDGRAELVTRVERSRGDSWRKELKDAKKPLATYRFHDLTAEADVVEEPFFEMEALGHAMDGAIDADAEEAGSPLNLAEFVDLDGDGRLDLVTVTFDFSIFQALKILTTKKLGVGIDFHVWAQQPDRSFVEVRDLDLSEKLKLDLDDLKIGRFAQFAGDFDGDGRQDFVHLGRGRTVTIHRGRAGCRYPAKADLAIELEDEPPSLDLVRIEDLDGDGRADLRITRPLPADDPDVTAPARLDLYLSGEGS